MLPSLKQILLCEDVRKCLHHHHVSQDVRQHVLCLIHLRSLPNSVYRNRVIHNKDAV
jgi:hypothetical protein